MVNIHLVVFVGVSGHNDYEGNESVIFTEYREFLFFSISISS